MHVGLTWALALSTHVCVPLVAALWALGCGSTTEPPQPSDRPIIAAQVSGPNFAGLSAAIAGNFLFEDPSTLQFRADGRTLAVRAMTPGWALVAVPLDGTSTVIGVRRTHDQGFAEANLPLEPELPAQFFHEVEPNETVEDATTYSLRFESQVTILAMQDVGDAGSTDVFIIEVPARVDGADRLSLRVEQSSHRADSVLSIDVKDANSAALASVSGAPGADLDVLVPLSSGRSHYQVTVTAPSRAMLERYDLEATIVSAAARPARPVLATRRDSATGLPTPFQGALDLGCDWPASIDVDNDGRVDVVCGEVFWNRGDATFEAQLSGPELRGVETWWRDFDANGQLDVLLVGPGPRTHHLYMQRGGSLIDETVAAGLSAITSLELLTAHVTDIDQDGQPDLIFVPTTGAPQIYRNLAGRFEAWSPWSTDPFAPGERAKGSVVFDADGDGDEDWLLFYVPEGGGPARPHRLENQGGAFEKRVTTEELWQIRDVRAIAASLVDDDAVIDLVLASERGVELYRGAGGITSAGFEPPVHIGDAVTVRGLGLDDVNGDGINDIYAFATEGTQMWLGRASGYASWRSAAALPRGRGLPWLLTEPLDAGQRAFLIDGVRYDMLAMPGHHLVVRVRDGQHIAWGTAVKATQGGRDQVRWIGERGFRTVAKAPEARFAFLDAGAVELEIRFPDGSSIVRQVDALDTTIEVVR